MFETFVGDKVTKRVNVWTCLRYSEGYDATWSGWLFDSGDRPQNYEMIQVVEIFPKCVGRRLEDEIAAPETSNGFNPSAPNRLGSMFCEMQFTHASSSYIDTSMIPFGYTHSYKYLYIYNIQIFTEWHQVDPIISPMEVFLSYQKSIRAFKMYELCMAIWPRALSLTVCKRRLQMWDLNSFEKD